MLYLQCQGRLVQLLDPEDVLPCQERQLYQCSHKWRYSRWEHGRTSYLLPVSFLFTILRKTLGPSLCLKRERRRLQLLSRSILTNDLSARALDPTMTNSLLFHPASAC